MVGLVRRDADPRGGGSSWPPGQVPAGQVLTVAEDQAAAITHEAWDHAAAIRQAAEQEAATIRQQAAAIQQQATDQAAAIRHAAEQEAAELRAALLAMSGELGRVASYVTQNLTAPGLPTTRPVALAPARPSAEPGAWPSAAPQAPPATRPGTRPTTKPAVRPAKPATRPRQFKAFRLATIGAAGLVILAVAVGSTEVATHGYKFFVFRQGGTGSSGNSTTDDQFLSQQNAAHHATKGAPAVKAHPVKGSPAVAHPAKGRHAVKAHHTAKAQTK
jgi:hypothetical protein